MQIEVDTVKGFTDYLPPESVKRRQIEKLVETVFQNYGFLPMETPIIEFDELMRSENLSDEEDESISDRFKLKDKAGRNLGLRYEFTFQLSRIFKQNPNIKLPFKRYQIGSIFRDEPIRIGRTRQFTQCDIDIIGDSSIHADAECLAVVYDVLHELKIKDFEIQVNNRKLMNSIIESVEIIERKQVMKELDKLNKIGEDEVKSNLKKYTSSNQVITLFKILEKPLSFFVENAFDGAEEIKKLQEKAKLYGIEFKFNPFMARGFGYYTGNIFEFVLPNKTSIVGGGRYDKVVGKHSYKEIPAVGISFSIESLTVLCEKELSSLKLDPSPKVLIVSLDEEKETIKIAKKLRRNNISCMTVFDNLSKQLEYANSLKISHVIILGSEEAQNEKYKLKDMNSGEQQDLTENQLIKKLK